MVTVRQMMESTVPICKTPKWGQWILVEGQLGELGWDPGEYKMKEEVMVHLDQRVRKEGATSCHWRDCEVRWMAQYTLYSKLSSHMYTLLTILTSRMAKWVRWSQPHFTFAAVSLSTLQLRLSHAPKPPTRMCTLIVTSQEIQYSRELMGYVHIIWLLVMHTQLWVENT